ncbi:MAG: NusG domain II-containing protein [Oscillospiraceae bacterium]|nr:NusG domain II-containing protein [Oscillospiraceae bacterium]
MKPKKKDIIFGAVVLAIAFSIFLYYHFTATSGAWATVTVVNGKSITIPLNKNETYTIEDASLPVTLEVIDGKIHFINAQCPDHLCEGFGLIGNEGEFAICIPAGVSVTVHENAQ